jgi:hypothetical protein
MVWIWIVSLKSPHGKALIPKVMLLGVGGTFGRWELLGVFMEIGSMSSKETVG